MVVHVGDSGVANSAAAEIALAGRRLRLWPLSLACCAVEAAEAVRWLREADHDPLCDSAAENDDPEVVNVLVVAGTVTWAMLDEVKQAWAELPLPRRAIAFGACTITGGPYWDSYAVVPGVLDVLPGAVAIPGCPPRPDTLLAGLKVALGGAEP